MTPDTPLGLLTEIERLTGELRHQLESNGTPPPPPTPAANGEPFLARAERILGGTVRPSDYLPVTDEVRAKTARDMEYGRARAAKYGVTEFEPAVERRQLEQWLLMCHCPGQMIAYLKDDTGFVVLARGWPQIEELLRHFPREKTLEVHTDTIDDYR